MTRYVYRYNKNKITCEEITTEDEHSLVDNPVFFETRQIDGHWKNSPFPSKEDEYESLHYVETGRVYSDENWNLLIVLNEKNESVARGKFLSYQKYWTQNVNKSVKELEDKLARFEEGFASLGMESKIANFSEKEAEKYRSLQDSLKSNERETSDYNILNAIAFFMHHRLPASGLAEICDGLTKQEQSSLIEKYIHDVDTETCAFINDFIGDLFVATGNEQIVEDLKAGRFFPYAFSNRKLETAFTFNDEVYGRKLLLASDNPEDWTKYGLECRDSFKKALTSNINEKFLKIIAGSCIKMDDVQSLIEDYCKDKLGNFSEHEEAVMKVVLSHARIKAVNEFWITFDMTFPELVAETKKALEKEKGKNKGEER